MLSIEQTSAPMPFRFVQNARHSQKDNRQLTGCKLDVYKKGRYPIQSFSLVVIGDQFNLSFQLVIFASNSFPPSLSAGLIFITSRFQPELHE